MPSDRGGSHVGRHVIAQPPLAAYRSLLVRITGAVIVCGLLTWGLPKPSRYYWPVRAMAERSEVVWGVEVVQPLVYFLSDFFVSRVTSPFVAGPVILGGALTLALAYRRRAAN